MVNIIGTRYNWRDLSSVVSNLIDNIVWVAISDQTDLGYLGGGGGADRLRGDGLGTQQHSWLSLHKGVNRLWERHL